MIINFSRASKFTECEQKAYIYDALNLTVGKTAEPLLTGGAYHHGAAHVLSTGDVPGAQAIAEAYYRDTIASEAKLFPEELIQVEQNIQFAKYAIAAFAEVHPQHDFKVLMPEVDFCVEIPNTIHHCFFVHKLLYGTSEAADRAQGKGVCYDPRCYINHHARGTTDGIVEWQKMIWLLEQKTASITGDIFYKKWALDMQPTIYMYGIWKQTGIRPHGFILNVIKKPNKQYKGSISEWFEGGRGIEREPFTRTDYDLERCAQEIATIASSYEDVISGRRKPTHSGAFQGNCIKWNRTCYYLERCKRGDTDIQGEFVSRKPDYVDDAYYKLLGMEAPSGDTRDTAVAGR